MGGDAQEMRAREIEALADAVERGSGISNRLDADIEIALFNPPEDGFLAVRKNDAGSKLIYTTQAGREQTHWAMDWTMDRPRAVSLLRARAASIRDTPNGQ